MNSLIKYNEEMLAQALAAFGLNSAGVRIQSFGSGLINHTWKISGNEQEFILQRINSAVFKQPEDVAANLALIDDYLKHQHPEYFFVAPVASLNGDTLLHFTEQDYFRLFPFVTGSHTIDVVETTGQAYEAAAQFGRFTRLLAGLNLEQLNQPIPDFHNLGLRYEQFLQALSKGNEKRIDECQHVILSLKQHAGIVEEFEAIRKNPAFKLRVTHHDTKISNVLFDEENRGICVIDLDTVMPGYFISDLGDMLRTYLCPAPEEDPDFTKITIREDFYHAIVQGYYSEMKNELSPEELDHFFYAGKFMIYMQSLRFITDYLNNDVYYGASYPTQNKVRGENQLILLQKLVEKEKLLKQGGF